MTDFKKWDRFDADAAEKEVERKVSAHQARGMGKLRRISRVHFAPVQTLHRGLLLTLQAFLVGMERT